MPVPGRARDIFLETAAVAVVIASLLTEGHTLAEIARRLGMQVRTTRVHLRSIFEKTGTSRQAELVALLGRLRL